MFVTLTTTPCIRKKLEGLWSNNDKTSAQRWEDLEIELVSILYEVLYRSPIHARAKMNNLNNVVKNLLQCCAVPLSRSTTIVRSLLTTVDKLADSTSIAVLL